MVGFLAAAIRTNKFVRLIELRVTAEEKTPAVDFTSVGGLMDEAIVRNTSITVLKIVGNPTPERWQKICYRNDCLTEPSPHSQLSSRDAIEADGVPDLLNVPWAFRAGDEFEEGVQVARGSFASVSRVALKGDVVAAKAHFALHNPDMYGLSDDAARQNIVRDCAREIVALRRIGGHENTIGFRGVAFRKYQGEVIPSWILMEFAEKTLHERIHSGESKLLPDMYGIANGLEFIHGKGMMHRDLKPKNVLVTSDGQIKIADFGSAKCWTQHSHETPTHDESVTHTMMGTPAYLAPEVRRTNSFRSLQALTLTCSSVAVLQQREARTGR